MKFRRDTPTTNIIMIVAILVSFSVLLAFIAKDVVATKMERKDYQMFKAVKIPKDSIN
jgi:hypothetical protein